MLVLHTQIILLAMYRLCLTILCYLPRNQGCVVFKCNENLSTLCGVATQLTLILLRHMKYKVKLSGGVEGVNIHKGESQIVLCTPGPPIQ